MATIELGEISGRRPEDSRPLGRDRRLAAAAVVVLCSLTVAGSAVPAPRGVRPLWSVSGMGSPSSALTADSAYVYRSDANSTRVSAYDLASGRLRWQRSFPGAAGYVQVAERAGLLLIPAEVSRTARPGYETVALSAATGAEAWRAPGEPYTVGGDTALMTADRKSVV